MIFGKGLQIRDPCLGLARKYENSALYCRPPVSITHAKTFLCLTILVNGMSCRGLMGSPRLPRIKLMTFIFLRCPSTVPWCIISVISIMRRLALVSGVLGGFPAEWKFRSMV